VPRERLVDMQITRYLMGGPSKPMTQYDGKTVADSPLGDWLSTRYPELSTAVSCSTMICEVIWRLPLLKMHANRFEI
jgi:hypothetical protein